MAYAVTLAIAEFGTQRVGDLAGARGFVVPYESADEAALVGQVPIYPAKTLLQVVEHLCRRRRSGCATDRGPPGDGASDAAYLSRPLRCQGTTGCAPRASDCRRRRSALLVGPPGTGKTMLAQRFAGILPPMTTDEALESAAVLSLVGQFATQRWATRIFRSPHHTSSAVALVGGGNPPLPGEISLAHHGVLFLDELPGI